MKGVLLLAYTPRKPSIGTENMLRCAYRAGFMGEALLHDERGGWNTGSGPDRILEGIPRTNSSHPEEVYECQVNTDKVRNQAINTPQRCGTLSRAGAPSMILPRNVTTSTGCRPVLLSFKLSPSVVGRRTTIPTASNEDNFGGSKASPLSSVRTPISLLESAWLSEWESVFPGLRYRKCVVRGIVSGSAKALARTRGEGNTDGDAVTDEFLWGQPS